MPLLPKRAAVVVVAWATIFAIATTIVHGQTGSNVVVIMIDDMRYMLDSDPYADEVFVQTRQVLDDRGVLFANAASPKPICTPSRAAFFVGRRPSHTGMLGLSDKLRKPWETFPGVLRKHGGYTTQSVGKTFDKRSFAKKKQHLSFERLDLCRRVKPKARRRECTFDDAISLHRAVCLAAPSDMDQYTNALSSAACTYTTEFKGAKRAIPMDPPNFRRAMFEPNERQYWGDDAPQQSLVYNGGSSADTMDHALTTAALTRLAELADGAAPFVAVVGLFKPHLPLVAPREDFDYFANHDFSDSHSYWTDTFEHLLPERLNPWFDERNPYANEYRAADNSEEDGYTTVAEIPRDSYEHIRLGYYATMRAADRQVRRVLDFLDDYNDNTRDNTHVILMSDHGFHLGEFQRIGKWTLAEASTRAFTALLPSRNFLAANPTAQVGTVVENPVDQIDVFPTVLDLVGLAERYVPLNKRDKLPGASLVPFLFDADTFVRAASVSNYRDWGGGNKKGAFAIRTRYFKLIAFPNSALRYLFDYRGGDYHRMIEREELAADPTYAGVLAELEALWQVAASSKDFGSWTHLLREAPFDARYSSVRGENFEV